MNEDFFIPAHTSSPLTVSLCGVSHCDGSYEIYRERSPLYVMEYVVSGSGTVSENGVSFTAVAGDIYFLKENRRHHYYSSKDNPWEKLWFNFSGKLADFITEAYHLREITHIHAPHLKGLFEKILTLAKEEPETAEDKIALVFLELAQKIAEITAASASSGIAPKLKGMLDGASTFNLSLDEFCAKLYCSKNHVIREFKTTYGTSPYEYLQRRRISVAEALLRNTVMQVSEIASSLGYYDIHYFSVSFKKRVGLTPTQYRKIQSESSPDLTN